MSMKNTRWQRPLLGSVVALSLLVGCDDSDSNDGKDSTVEGTEDASTTPRDGAVKEPDAAEGDIDAGLEDGAVTAEDGAVTAEDAAVTPMDATALDGTLPDAESPEAGLPQAKLFALSADGPDRLCDVAYDAQGNIFAVGFRAAEAAPESDRELIVVKFTSAGVIDTTWATQGIASKNVTVGGKAPAVTDCQGGGESARAIVLHGTKITIGGTAETEAAAALPPTDVGVADTDIVLVRFNVADGSVDTAFGTDGALRVATNILNKGIKATPTATSWSAPNRLWSVTPNADKSKLILNGATRTSESGTSTRTDTDFALIRVNTADGSLDTTFSDDGVFTLDVLDVGQQARSATVLANGDIVGSGYMTGPLGAAGTTNGNLQAPVLYKVTSSGVLDPSFANDAPNGSIIGNYSGVPGVYYGILTGTTTPVRNAEAYGAALQSSGKFVTMGYGGTPTVGGVGSDVVSFRFTEDGKYDRTYGTDGYVYLDVAGFADNGRGILVLPDSDRVVGLGGGRPMPAQPPAPDAGQPTNVDALVTIFTKDGAPDTTFGPKGFRTYDLGGTGDFFFNAAVSPDKKSLAIVGYKGLGASLNDDSALLILPL